MQLFNTICNFLCVIKTTTRCIEVLTAERLVEQKGLQLMLESTSEMTYIVLGGALNSTHSLTDAGMSRWMMLR